MKTLKRIDQKTKTVDFKRITDDKVESYLSSGWEYCPKSEWKTNVRDLNKTENSTGNEEKIYKKTKRSKK